MTQNSARLRDTGIGPVEPILRLFRIRPNVRQPPRRVVSWLCVIFSIWIVQW